MDLYPPLSKELARKRAQLAPEISATFKKFSQAVFADGALHAKTKQLIAVAVSHVTQCPYCIRGHTELAVNHGATAGSDGSDLGRRGNARRRRLRACEPCA